MKSVQEAIKHVLKSDPLVLAFVGYDGDGEPKVYEILGKKDVQPPYVVWQRIPGGREPSGTYGDARAMEFQPFQITAWARDKSEAWALFDVVQEALEIGEWDVELTPYTKMRLIRAGDETEMLDVDTRWIQIPCTYRLIVSR